MTASDVVRRQLQNDWHALQTVSVGMYSMLLTYLCALLHGRGFLTQFLGPLMVLN